MVLLGDKAHALWPTMHSCLSPRRSRDRQLPRQDQHLKVFPSDDSASTEPNQQGEGLFKGQVLAQIRKRPPLLPESVLKSLDR